MTKTADIQAVDPFEAALGVSDVKGRSPWEDAWHRLLKNRAAVYSAFIMAFIILLVVFGPMLISWESDFTDWDYTSTPPSFASGHWFGTDSVGRDILVRTLEAPEADAGEGTDFNAIRAARVSITPIHTDLTRIAALDSRIRAIAQHHATVRLLMTAPGVGAITALAVVATFDDASRFRRSSSAGAQLGLTPRRYESGEISRNGRVSKRGDGFTQKCLFEAANAIVCRGLGGSRLRDWGRAIAERTGPRKAKVALARKLAVTPHAMWRTNTPFKETVTA